MKTTLIVIVGIILFGVGATYHRYQSFNPCDWIERDLAVQSGMPTLIVQGQIKTWFLMDGVVKPDPYQCIKMWWRLKIDGDLKPVPKPDKKK